MSIEVHTGMFPGPGGGEKGGLHDETFLRVLSIAKRLGCLFHFASDSHDLGGIGSVKRLEPYVRQLGITKEDVHPLFR